MKFFALIALALVSVAPLQAFAAEPKSTRILLVTSGCCHDYDFQTKSLQLAFDKADIPAVWTVVNDGGDGKDKQFELFNQPNWAADFDLVIHNECFADTTDPQYIRNITAAHHRGLDAIVIHCAMHTFRDAKIDDWRELLGVTSRRHDHQSRYPVDVVAAKHPIMDGVPTGYTTPMDELYVIEKVWPDTEVLATSKSEKDGNDYPVFWLHSYGDAKIFGTTYGHSNETFSDQVFLNVLTNAARFLTN